VEVLRRVFRWSEVFRGEPRADITGDALLPGESAKEPTGGLVARIDGRFEEANVGIGRTLH
jgi:hypothetical protein